MERVLIVGATSELGRTEDLYSRGFSSAGSEVHNFNWKSAAPALFSRQLSDRIARRITSHWILYQANQKLIEVARQFRPTLTFVVAPIFMMPDTVRQLKTFGPAFVFFTDNPLDDHHTHSNTWVRDSFPLWDSAFIWSKKLAQELTGKGVKRAIFHAFCSDATYHFPKQQDTIDHDVVFIGNWDDSGKRESFLQSISHHSLGLWGSPDWDSRCRIKSLQGRCAGMCSYEEIPNVISGAHIGLNILRPQNESGHNIRTFEIPACGALMLSERSPGLLDLFIEDQEAMYFSTPEELALKTEYLLSHPTQMKSIAKAGFQKAMNNKIENRIEEIEVLYLSLKNAALVC